MSKLPNLESNLLYLKKETLSILRSKFIELTVLITGDIVASQNPLQPRRKRRVDHQALVDGLHCGILNGKHRSWLIM